METDVPYQGYSSYAVHEVLTQERNVAQSVAHCSSLPVIILVLRQKPRGRGSMLVPK